MFFDRSIKPVFSKSQALYARFNKLNLDLDIWGNFENLTDKVQSNIYDNLLNRQKSACIVLHMAAQVASVRVCLLWLGGASGHIGGRGRGVLVKCRGPTAPCGWLGRAVWSVQGLLPLVALQAMPSYYHLPTCRATFNRCMHQHVETSQSELFALCVLLLTS